MLLEFSIDNFRCYKENITFDFANNISAIFGANSSGKTNMLRCLFYSIKMIKENMGINKSPVLFQPNDKKKPVSIKIKFSDVENNIFLYELSVDNKSIISEKYTALKFKDKENLIIFQKNFNEISISNIFKNKDLIDVFIKQIKLDLAVSLWYNYRYLARLLRFFESLSCNVSVAQLDRATAS